jgi:hypothetical protein
MCNGFFQSCFRKIVKLRVPCIPKLIPSFQPGSLIGHKGFIKPVLRPVAFLTGIMRVISTHLRICLISQLFDLIGHL